MTYVILTALSFAQNISFAMLGRARNRDAFAYHAVCAVLSNGLWLATIGLVVQTQFNAVSVVAYIGGTVCGSLVGAKISMSIESTIGASV